MGSTLGPRRFRTEDWSLGVERRFLELIGVRPGVPPYVPRAARIYFAFGFVVYQVYVTDAHGWLDIRGPEPRRRWKLRYVGRQGRNFP